MRYTSSLAPLLAIDHATVRRNKKHLIDGLTLEIAQGEHTAILGPNGSGKSTLMKVITNQLHPLAHKDGRQAVTLFGQSRWNVFELRAQLGIVSSDIHEMFVNDPSLSGFDAVLSGFFASQGIAAHHNITHEMRLSAFDALSLMGANDLGERPMSTMSTGEARRVLIARALAPGPKALILDEPTIGLDLVAMRRFLETLRTIARSGRTLVLVTHHVEEILPEVNRVILLRNGRVFLDGPKSQVLTTENLTALFGASVIVREQAGYYSAETDAIA